MLFLWFYHACRRGAPRFLMVSDHINYLTFEDPGAVNTVRRALKLAHAGDLHGAAEVAGVDVAHAAVVSEGLRRGMHFSIGAELDNDPRSRPDAQNIVEAMKPDGMIRSVHFLTVEHPEKGPDFSWPFDNPEFVSLHDSIGAEKTWSLYMERLLDDIEKLPGQIVGHFYVPGNFGHWPAQKQLEAYEDQLISACAARGMAIEVNTRYLYRERTDEVRTKMTESYTRLIKKAHAKGVGIAAGSDAHSPRDQANGFETLLAILDEAGVNELVFPVAGRLARVALRATRENLERHAPRNEPVAAGSSISGFSRAELGLPAQPELVGRARDAAAKKRTAPPPKVKVVKVKAPPKVKVVKEKPVKIVKEKPVKIVKEKPIKVVVVKPVKEKLAPKVAAKKPEPAKPVAPAKVATKKPVAPVKKIVAPAKKAPAPVKKIVAPAKKAAVPAKKIVAPTKKAAVPAKKIVAPVKKAAVPAKKIVAPAKKAAVPVKKVAMPAKKAVAPVKKPAVPAKKATVPAKKAAAPVKKALAAKAAPPKKAAPAKAVPKPTTKKKPTATKRR